MVAMGRNKEYLYKGHSDLLAYHIKKYVFIGDFIYTLAHAAQHCFAADAAGAAPELGAIVWRGGAPSLVPVGGGGQRRR